MDWTGSMQEFGSKVILWYAMNMQRCGIRYIVLFTDGAYQKGTMGNYGGIYFTEVKNIKKIIQLMKLARNQAMNREVAENDVEAILKGIQRFPKFDELILIADNRSCMRDFCLAWKINVPVKIVLCGTTGGINPQYVTLAYMTKGSIHTIDSDIYDINPVKLNSDTLTIDNSVFAFDQKKKRFFTIGGETRHQNCRRFYGTCK